MTRLHHGKKRRGRDSNREPPVWKSDVLSARPRQLLLLTPMTMDEVNSIILSIWDETCVFLWENRYYPNMNYGKIMRNCYRLSCYNSLALEEFHRKVKKPRGKQKTTWVKCANEDLNSLNLPTLESAELKFVVTDRTCWRALHSESAKPTKGVKRYQRRRIHTRTEQHPK